MSEPESGAPRLAMRGIEKSFGSTHALRGVDLSVASGEVHALVGENGAGKSTLVKVLSGAIAPDSGSMVLDGEDYSPSGPVGARARGVSMIYQELNLAPDLSVEENVFLGMERARFGFVDRAGQTRAVSEALELLGHAGIDPQTEVRRLGVATQQIVEIARALITNSRVIVLDEPTSSLTAVDTERLFEVIRKLRGKGVSIIYISHFLEEVQTIADRFTVLREGETVGGGVVGEVALEEIIALMVGRTLEEFFPRVPHERGEPLLEVVGLSGTTAPRDVDLTLHRGEILGVAGLVGAGRTEMLRAIYQLDPVQSGAVSVAGFSLAGSPRRAVRAGLGFLSENRKEEGLGLDLSIADNVSLSSFARVARRGWVSTRRQLDRVRGCLDALHVKCRSPLQPVGDLSGGNQQKVALARIAHQEADVVLLDEPTRGIDVGSKIEVYRQMGELAAAGKAVLFVSSYLPELLGVCDRLAVMSRGRMSEVRDVGEWSETTIMAYATGSES